MDINKLPAGVRVALRDYGRSDAEVAIMSARGVFEDYCNWNGIINWSDTLWETMQTLVAAQPTPAPKGEDAAAADLLLTLEQAAARVEIANKEGNPILSAWLPDAQAIIKKERARLTGAPVSSPLSVAGAPVPKADGEACKVVVVMTGGVVDSVVAAKSGLSVAVIDYDKNADLDDMIMIPQGDGERATALAGIHDVLVDAARATELYAAVEEAEPAAEAVATARP